MVSFVLVLGPEIKGLCIVHYGSSSYLSLFVFSILFALFLADFRVISLSLSSSIESCKFIRLDLAIAASNPAS